MQANREQPPTLPRRVLLQALLLGTAIGIALLVIDGPLWLCYVAPLLVVPFVVHHLRALDPAGHGGGTPRSGRDQSEDR